MSLATGAGEEQLDDLDGLDDGAAEMDGTGSAFARDVKPFHEQTKAKILANLHNNFCPLAFHYSGPQSRIDTELAVVWQTPPHFCARAPHKMKPVLWHDL